MNWTKTLRACVLSLSLLALAPLSLSAQAQDRSGETLRIERGHSFIYDQKRAIKQIILGDPEIISVESLSPEQFRIKGLAVGSTNLWVIFSDAPSRPVSYEIYIQQDLSDLIQRIDDIVDGGSAPKAYPVNGRLVLDGTVDSLQELEQIAAVARLFDEEFVNLMSVGGDHQVQLQVVFAEVNRSGLRELGMNALYGDSFLGLGLQSPGQTGTNSVFRSDASTPNNINGGSLRAPLSGTFNVLGVFGSPIDLSAILSVLEQNGVSKTLAQPTLVALSGQQAEFLAGGEVPVPAQSNNNRIVIDFKEYGIKLMFVPTVLGGEVIDMRVYVEVSDVDPNNAVRLTGIEIPAFVSRKSSSHMRVESGMTFAMAGMLQETTRQTTQQIPLLGEIPILGALFRSVKYERDETELMIFVTPHLVRPMAPDEVPPPPGTTEQSNPNDFELFLLGLDHRVGSRTAEPTGPIGLER